MQFGKPWREDYGIVDRADLLREISRRQAIVIAMEHLGYRGNRELKRLISVRQGSTREGGEGAYSRSVGPPSDHCWIVRTSARPRGQCMTDGPYAVVWVDQRTGQVVQAGRGSGG